MLSAPPLRHMWQQVLSGLHPVDTQRYASAFLDAAGHPDVAAVEQSYITRHLVLQAWGQFQQTHPLIVAPIEVPPRAGSDLDDNRVAKELNTMRMAIAVNALGLPAVPMPVGIQDGLPQAVQLILALPA